MTASRVLSLLCLTICAAALVGCDGDTFSFDPVASAASKTVDSTSSRVQFTATMNVEGVGGMAFSGSGIFDGRTRSGAMNMRFTLPPEAQAQLGASDPTMQMIMDGRNVLVMYMRSPMFKTVAADKWLKIDMEKLAKKEGVDISALMNANQTDPHPNGYDRVRGVFTTHYKLNSNITRLTKGNKQLRKTFESVRKLTGIS